MKRKVRTTEEKLKAIPMVWVKNGDTKVRCRRDGCSTNARATYWLFTKTLEGGERYSGWFCFNCRKASPFTEEHGFSQEIPSSIEDKDGKKT